MNKVLFPNQDSKGSLYEDWLEYFYNKCRNDLALSEMPEFPKKRIRGSEDPNWLKKAY
jgi:hypothetical protein